jgi:hypothetical protein
MAGRMGVESGTILGRVCGAAVVIRVSPVRSSLPTPSTQLRLQASTFGKRDGRRGKTELVVGGFANSMCERYTTTVCVVWRSDIARRQGFPLSFLLVVGGGAGSNRQSFGQGLQAGREELFCTSGSKASDECREPDSVKCWLQQTWPWISSNDAAARPIQQPDGRILAQIRRPGCVNGHGGTDDRYN